MRGYLKDVSVQHMGLSQLAHVEATIVFADVDAFQNEFDPMLMSMSSEVDVSLVQRQYAAFRLSEEDFMEDKNKNGYFQEHKRKILIG